METSPESSSTASKNAVLKAVVFIGFIAAAIALVRFTPVKGYLNAGLGDFLDTAGIWAPLVFIGIYTVGVCVFLPGTLLTALGAAIFGAY